MTQQIDTVILISANAEWNTVWEMLGQPDVQKTPYGGWFTYEWSGRDYLMMQGGWGKTAAAGSAQYAIDRWHPSLLVNLGTCGGFSGKVERGQIILVNRTIIYDIIEQMGDPEQAILDRSCELDLSWIGNEIPAGLLLHTLVSADRDILPVDIPILIKKYNAVAADWESGSIAWVAKKNGVRCLIMRGVTDLVGESGGDIYGNYDEFIEQARSIMRKLFALIGWWV